MESDFWSALGLVPASHKELAAGKDDLERQPAPCKLAFPATGSMTDQHVAVARWQEQEPVERIVNSILLCAIQDGASDVHIEPQAQGVAVRYRVQGQFKDHLRLPGLVLDPLVKRLKQLGKLDEATPEAQCGLFRLRLDDYDYELQISTFPTEFGQSVQLRVGCARP